MSDIDRETQRRWVSKKKAGTEVWFGTEPQDLPYKKLGPLNRELFASYTGPDNGLVLIHELENDHKGSPTKRNVAGAERWNLKNRKCYGICMSLYDQHPINGKISGDPIADSFALCARRNNACLVVADGVNWGEKSKMAARCAVHGCMKYVNSQLFGSEGGRTMKTSHDVFVMLLRAIQEAHQSILRHQAGLTTLCVALVLPTRDPKQYLVCVVNVGDSLAFVYSKFHGIREITTGSHDIRSERDIRDAGGALGPVHADLQPELNNLTFSMTFVDLGDIVYLTTDGISDNFDPVVTKIAVAKRGVPMKVHDDIDPITEEVETEVENMQSKDNTLTCVADTDVKENGNDGIDMNGGKQPCESQLFTDVCESTEEGKVCNTANAGDGDRVDISQKNNSSHSSGNQATTNVGNVDSLINNMQQEEPLISGGSTTTPSLLDGQAETNGNSVEFTQSKTPSQSDGSRHVVAVAANNNNNNQGGKSKTCPLEFNKLKNPRDGHNQRGSGEDTAKHAGPNNGRDLKSSQQRNAHTLSSTNSSIDHGCESAASSCGIQDGKPEMEPHERHRYAVKEMERVVLEFELFTEEVVCAQELCGALLQHILKLTDSKRKVLENPNLYRRRRVKKRDKEKRDSEIYAALGKAPGKLDHATIVAYEVGRFHGDEDEDYERSDPELDAFGSDAGSSVTTSVNDLATNALENLSNVTTTTTSTNAGGGPGPTNIASTAMAVSPLTSMGPVGLPGMPAPLKNEDIQAENMEEIFV